MRQAAHPPLPEVERRIVLEPDAGIMAQRHMRKERNIGNAGARRGNPVQAGQMAVGEVILEPAQGQPPGATQRFEIARRAEQVDQPGLRQRRHQGGGLFEPAFVLGQPVAILPACEVAQDDAGVAQAQRTRAPMQRLADRVSFWFVLAVLAIVLVVFVALQHLGFLVLEMVFWTKPLGRKVFGLDREFAERSAALAKNQGLYNGFLAAGLAWGLWLGDKGICLFFLGCVVVAGLFGAESVFAAALVAGCLSLEAIKGSVKPFDARIHAARGQAGQIAVAAAVRALLGTLGAGAVVEAGARRLQGAGPAGAGRRQPPVIGPAG